MADRIVSLVAAIVLLTIAFLPADQLAPPAIVRAALALVACWQICEAHENRRG